MVFNQRLHYLPKNSISTCYRKNINKISVQSYVAFSEIYYKYCILSMQHISSRFLCEVIFLPILCLELGWAEIWGCDNEVKFGRKQRAPLDAFITHFPYHHGKREISFWGAFPHLKFIVVTCLLVEHFANSPY